MHAVDNIEVALDKTAINGAWNVKAAADLLAVKRSKVIAWVKKNHPEHPRLGKGRPKKVSHEQPPV